MPLFRFPFRFGSVPDSSVVSTPVPPDSPGGVPSRWASLSGSAARWAGGASAVRQFHRIHTQTVLTFGQSVNFAYRVNDAFPLKVRDNGDHIHVASTITNP